VHKQHSEGFTIVELLIVIIVIAILAVITIVAYSTISSQASTSVLKNDLATSSRSLSLFQVDNSSFPTGLDCTATPAQNAICLKSSGDVAYTSYSSVNNTEPQTFCLEATKGTLIFHISEAGQVVQGACGGGPTIVNIASNPGVYINADNYSSWAGDGGGATNSGRTAVGWSTRGYAFRNTWIAQNNSYTGDVGYEMPNVGGGASLTPNTQYTARWKVVSSKPQRLSPQVGNWTISGGGGWSGSGATNTSSGDVVVSTATPTDQWITFTTGNNTVGVKLYTTLISGAGASYWTNDDYIEISDLIITEGSDPVIYADGASPGWSWIGSAHASRSTGPSL
jgi:prepilin-type N-terminal cleavage/methylation domain-containing protein